MTALVFAACDDCQLRYWWEPGWEINNPPIRCARCPECHHALRAVRRADIDGHPYPESPRVPQWIPGCR